MASAIRDCGRVYYMYCIFVLLSLCIAKYSRAVQYFCGVNAHISPQFSALLRYSLHFSALLRIYSCLSTILCTSPHCSTMLRTCSHLSSFLHVPHFSAFLGTCLHFFALPHTGLHLSALLRICLSLFGTFRHFFARESAALGRCGCRRARSRQDQWGRHARSLPGCCYWGWNQRHGHQRRREQRQQKQGPC